MVSQFDTQHLLNSNTALVAGVDEAGRGPLAGPVVVAAVVFDPSQPRINGLNDSKQLSPACRERLYAHIVERALAYKVVMIDSTQIDTLNIYQATMLGMRLAVEGVAHVAKSARIDGNRLPKTSPARLKLWSAVTHVIPQSWPLPYWPKSPATAIWLNCICNIHITASTNTKGTEHRHTWPL